MRGPWWAGESAVRPNGGFRVTSFLSTFINKVDRKGRVSVPAPFRAALAGEPFQGIIAYPSLADPAIDAFGGSMLTELSRRRHERNLQDGDFEAALLGGSNSIFDTIMAMVHEIPFDGEGRVVLPATLAARAGIDDRAAFVGRGSRFQIWSPESFERHHQAAVDALRVRIANRGDGGVP